MVQQPDIDQFKGRFEALRDALVSLAWLRDPAWMIVGKYDGCRVDGKCLFDDFPRIHRCAVDRAAEYFVKSQHAMAIVEVQTAKQLVVQVAHACLQESLGIARAADWLADGQRFEVVATGELRYCLDGGGAAPAYATAAIERAVVRLQQCAQAAEPLEQPSGKLQVADRRGQQLDVATVLVRVVFHADIVVVREYLYNHSIWEGSPDSLTIASAMNIVLGITGGIAAYKAPDLVRRLRERGAEVQIVITKSAEEFVTGTALQAVSGRPIRSSLWDKEAEAAMSHIELARWADVVLIAPATAEVMARIVSGAAPDLLTTICLATEAPIAVAPAMNHVMWSNPATQENRETLERRGIHILGPDVGSQACGETGAGRMLDPDVIAASVYALTGGKGEGRLEGRKVVITAGPTREPIDPVRYITNRSSGKMGYAIARAAAAQGADVTIVSGPVSIAAPLGVEVVSVETAAEMHEATHATVADADIFVAAAAVADYRPASAAEQKIKKNNEEMSIELVRCPDILASVAALNPAPFTVGFAAETENVTEYARGKLEKKNLDMIVANRVGSDCGFDRDDNAATVLWRDGEKVFPTASKADLGRDLVELIAQHFYAERGCDTQPKLNLISNSE